MAFLALLVLSVRAAETVPAPKKAEEQFKNIQVLKGIPAEDLFPAMQFIAASLNQDCEFCHVERAPEKDDKKEKQIARKMIAMTLAIDRDNFARTPRTSRTRRRGITGGRSRASPLPRSRRT